MVSAGLVLVWPKWHSEVMVDHPAIDALALADQLRAEATLRIVGLSDRGEVSISAISKLLAGYDADRAALPVPTGLNDGDTLSDSEILDLASRMIRRGAAAFVQTVTGEGPFYMFGPGFQAEITRTNPNADYPGSINDQAYR